jgi:hypothetical protein
MDFNFHHTVIGIDFLVLTIAIGNGHGEKARAIVVNIRKQGFVIEFID